jgi:predicted transcriptional regulator
MRRRLLSIAPDAAEYQALIRWLSGERTTVALADALKISERPLLEPKRSRWLMWIVMWIKIASMITVQMTLDPDLVARVDKAARQLGLTRSAFARCALADALERLRQRALEERHRRGYRRKPVSRGEFDVWTSEQSWPD